MGLPVTIYRSTDPGSPLYKPGAPLKPSDWLPVFQKCLVDGYGTKAGLGWTLDYGSVAELKMVFRNSIADGGSGGAVKIESNPSTDTVTSGLKFTCANGITGLDAFDRRVGSVSTLAESNGWYIKGWTLIGTSRGFWFIIEANGNTAVSMNTNCYHYTACFFIGDIDSFIPNDSGIFTCLASGYGRDDPMVDLPTSRDRAMILGSPNGTAARATLYEATGGSLYATYSTRSGGHNATSSGATLQDPQGLGVPIDLLPEVLVGGSGSVTLPRIRGVVPGLYTTSYIGWGNDQLPIIRNYGGVDYYLNSGYYIPRAFIQASGEWYV